MKGRKEKKETILLNFSMDTQCMFSNANDKLQISEIIDMHDDEREKAFREKLQERMLYLHDSIEDEDIYKIKKEFKRLENFFIKEFEKRDHYEKLDDENRVNLKNYLQTSTEKVRENNYKIECELVKK